VHLLFCSLLIIFIVVIFLYNNKIDCYTKVIVVIFLYNNSYEEIVANVIITVVKGTRYLGDPA